MSKSRARFLSELLGTTGLVKKSKSALAGADEVIDLSTLPTIPNSKLQNSSITIADHSTALGGSVSLNTGDISEHNNYKYYTDARVDARIAAADTGDLSEGSNLYFTNARADARVNLQTGSNLNLSSKDTGDLSEGSNLYFTNARADARIAAADTDDLSEGSSNLYYTDARADARVALVVDSAPSTLNTLNELAAALGDDDNFSTTVTNSIATKLPLAGGTMTGNLTINKEDPNINLSDTSTSRTLAMFVDNNNSVVRASGPLLLQVGSQSAITIDASRNTTFAGTISSGAITSTGDFSTTGSITSTDGSGTFEISGDSNSNTYLIATGEIRVRPSGTSVNKLVIGSNGNITTAGTISSGAITSTGDISVNSGKVRVGNPTLLSGRSSIRIDSNGDSFADLVFGDNVTSTSWTNANWAISSRSSSESNSLKIYRGSGQPSPYNSEHVLMEFKQNNVVSVNSTLQINNTTVIDSSRNLTNIGTISSGRITSSGTGVAAAPTLDIINSSSNTYNHSIEAMTPNLTAGESNILVFGRDSSTKNSGYIGYKYSSAGSNDNVITLGHWAADHLVTINGVGNVNIAGNIGMGTSLYLGSANKSRLSSDNNGSLGINYGTTGGTNTESLVVYNNTTKAIILDRSGAITSTGIFKLNSNAAAANGTGNLKIIPTLSNAGGVGYAGQVIGVNIESTINTSNQPEQDSTWGGVTGATAIALQADDNSYGQFQVWTSPQSSSAGTALTPRFWINGSGAATFAGTISSGAITSSGAIVGSTVQATGNIFGTNGLHTLNTAGDGWDHTINRNGGNPTANLPGGITSGAITSSGDVKLNGNTKKYAAPVYRDTVTGISNSGYTTLFTVDGGGLASTIKMTLVGTANAVVVNATADIVVGHYQDILITSSSGFYTTVTLKVISNNNEDFAVQAKTNSGTSVSLDCEVFPLNNELITFTTSHSFTGSSHEHTCYFGTHTSGTGGNDGDLTVNGRTFTQDGTIAAPALTFRNDHNTGLYRVGSDSLGWVVGASRKFYTSASRAYFQNLSEGVDVPSLRLSGTEIITTSRNIYNIGTIGSTYFNTSSNVNQSGVGGANIPSGYRLGFDQSGVRSWMQYAAGGNLLLASGDGAGAVQANNFNATASYQVGGVTVIDVNKRLLVSDGSASAPYMTFSADTNTGFYRPAADNIGFAVGGAARAFMSGTQFNMTGNGVFSGSLSVGGAVVIDSSRNLTNIGTIASGDIHIKSGTSGTNTQGLLFSLNDNADAQAYIKKTGYYMHYNAHYNEGHRFTVNGSDDMLRMHGSNNGTRPDSIDILAANGLYMNSTQVIDAARNLKNVGTINTASQGEVIGSKWTNTHENIYWNSKLTNNASGYGNTPDKWFTQGSGVTITSEHPYNKGFSTVYVPSQGYNGTNHTTTINNATPSSPYWGGVYTTFPGATNFSSTQNSSLQGGWENGEGAIMKMVYDGSGGSNATVAVRAKIWKNFFSAGVVYLRQSFFYYIESGEFSSGYFAGYNGYVGTTTHNFDDSAGRHKFSNLQQWTYINHASQSYLGATYNQSSQNYFNGFGFTPGTAATVWIAVPGLTTIVRNDGKTINIHDATQQIGQG